MQSLAKRDEVFADMDCGRMSLSTHAIKRLSDKVPTSSPPVSDETTVEVTQEPTTETPAENSKLPPPFQNIETAVQYFEELFSSKSSETELQNMDTALLCRLSSVAVRIHQHVTAELTKHISK